MAFQPTENEQILGDFVQALVKDPTADQLGISNWDAVKLKLGNLTRPDLTKMIREVREGAVSELKETLEKCIGRMINSPKALTMPGPD